MKKYKILDPEASFLAQKIKEKTSILIDRYVPTREEIDEVKEEDGREFMNQINLENEK